MLFRSACMMLDYLSEKEASNKIRLALEEVLSDEKNFTKDLAGNLTTDEFTNTLISTIKKGAD